jgi:acyl carrier protein
VIQSKAAANELDGAMAAVSDLIRSVSEKARSKVITPGTLLLEDLALDSLDMVRIVMLIEDRYGVSLDLDAVADMKSVDDLARSLVQESRSAA